MKDKSKNQTWYSFNSSSQMVTQLQRRLTVLVIIIVLFMDVNTHLVSAQVPLQCLKFINLTEVKNGRGVIITTIPEILCDHSPGKNSWYRFKYGSVNKFFWTNYDVADSTQSTPCPNQTSPLHPCNVYETIGSTFCFNPRRFVAHSVNITHCGSTYVYQLPQFRCKKKKPDFYFADMIWILQIPPAMTVQKVSYVRVGVNVQNKLFTKRVLTACKEK